MRRSPSPLVEDVESTSYATTKVGAPRSRGSNDDDDQHHQQSVGLGGTHGQSGQRRRRQQRRQEEEYEQPQQRVIRSRNGTNSTSSRRETTTTKKNIGGSPTATSASSTSSSTAASRWIMVLICLFVLSDILYLYRLSTNALLVHYPVGLKAKQQSMSSSNLEQHQEILQAQKPPPPNNNNLEDTTATELNKNVNHDNQIHDDDDYDEKSTNAWNNNSTTNTNSNNDKERIYEILHQAGINVQNNDLNQETIDSLPTWKMITELFGPGPRIVGLERCEEFRSNTDPTIRFFGIAGTFNSGTNLLSELMIQNCQITERMLVYGNKSKGIRWQGKYVT